ncbi:phosphoenolpyruvate carboxylase [Candidatus Pelagibacter sp.]|nr:phosphoenolpyruvate carboxylase [Candidatus Pelagibacter bacterium]MDB3889013.1 phosphoenolpyruvate carboxylase [Candidatus Pelagibacter sp.]MDC1002095.1 phosphoenolpyruvate carboxylase [Candidatus Pelagibacter sp.]MDC3396096.1 phosphoenolpyruvate carboxylase [Candidatus Pelagibacter sp.]
MKKRDLYYERIPTKLLREDIRFLGTFLGKVIKDQEGEAFFKIVERLRLLSKNILLDKQKSKVFLKISKEIKKLPPELTFKITRAFLHILNLMNLAESLDASRKLNEHNNPYFKNKNQNLFIEDIIEGLFKNKSISDSKIYEQAKNLDIGIVLTAHPTEVKRRTLIQKYANLINLMEQRHLYKKYPSKVVEIDRKLYTEITIIWKTDELKRSKPSPLDEARWGLAVIEDSLWDTIPKVYKRLNDIFRKNLNKDLPRGFNPIQFGSWMGGDRDGNPNVTAQVTKKVILFSRWQAAKLYEKELTKLIQDLSMKECSPKIKKITGKTFEPYRVYLRPIRDKIRSTYKIIENHLNNHEPLKEDELLQDKNEILKPLRDIRESLNSNNSQHIANSDLLDLIRRVRCFGINLARLDIRQESSRHEQLLNEILKKKSKINYSNLNEQKKISLLNNLIKQKKYFLDKLNIINKENKEVWDTFKQISKEPAQCLGAYVISMTSKASDILSVYFLQKQAQTKNLLRVVPLFETLDDLKNAKDVMENLFKLSWYRKLINHQQEVMIGYSDSSKDAGKLSASWHQYKLQEELRDLAKKYKIDLVFFHGRGGSAGRGGGPIQATLKSQPSNTVNGKIRITDQGEVIQQKYGYKPLAEYNLCSYIGAVMDASLNPPPRSKKNWRNLIEKMSEISTSAYRKNLNQSEDFIRYFKTVTPHKSLGKLAIGSRPTKRKNIDNIQSLRAIPWVFAWTQIRLMLPAWLGTTEALRYGSIKKYSKTLTDMEKNWPYFVSTMDILDMVISKVDPEISIIYENNLADDALKRIGKKLRFQFDALVKLHNKITPKEVIKERKEFRKALFIRNNYTEMLNILQASIMNKINNRKYKKQDKKFLNDALMTSIAGISAAMKNTG